jgi:hypothetical protein
MVGATCGGGERNEAIVLFPVALQGRSFINQLEE